MGILPCPLPCQIIRESSSDSDQFHSKHSHSDSLSSSSSSNFSLLSQPSLPSVPSLTLPSQLQNQPSTITHYHCLSTLKGHSSYIFSITLSGQHLYSGSSDSEIRIWNRKSPTIQAHHHHPDNVVAVAGTSGVKSMVVLSDKLFTSHQDHKIRVWKIQTNDYEVDYNYDDSNSNNYTAHMKYQCIATLPTINDRIFRIFSTKNYVEVRRHRKSTWVHHVDTVSALALSKDGSLLYSASWDRTFKLWRTSDFKCLESVWNAHDDAINALVLSTDGFVYTGSADNKIKVWKRSEGDKRHRLVDTLEKHKSAVNALALSSDGLVLYSGACDRSIIVWEKHGSGGGHMVVAVGALRGHTKAILCLTVVSDLLCSGSADKTVRIWRKGLGRNYSCLAVLEGHRGPVKCLTAAVDSCTNDNGGTSYLVYSGSLDCDIMIWQIWVSSF